MQISKAAPRVLMEPQLQSAGEPDALKPAASRSRFRIRTFKFLTVVFLLSAWHKPASPQCRYSEAGPSAGMSRGEGGGLAPHHHLSTSAPCHEGALSANVWAMWADRGTDRTKNGPAGHRPLDRRSTIRNSVARARRPFLKR